MWALNSSSDLSSLCIALLGSSNSWWRMQKPNKPVTAQWTTTGFVQFTLLHMQISPLPSDKPAADSCRGSSCGSPERHPRWLCAQTACQVSPRCICSHTLLSGEPRRRSASRSKFHQTDAGPGTSVGTGLWCAELLCSCWALPPCSAPRFYSRCCKTPAPHCHIKGRKAPEKLLRTITRHLRVILTRLQPVESFHPSSASVQTVRSDRRSHRAAVSHQQQSAQPRFTVHLNVPHRDVQDGTDPRRKYVVSVRDTHFVMTPVWLR